MRKAGQNPAGLQCIIPNVTSFFRTAETQQLGENGGTLTGNKEGTWKWFFCIAPCLCLLLETGGNFSPLQEPNGAPGVKLTKV